MNKKPTKQPYHHGDLPVALITAAVSLISQQGISKLSLREVARIAGVSHGAPAHHFGDKKGLFTAIAAEGYRRRTQRMKEALLDTEGSDINKLVIIGRAYVLFAVDEPAFFEVMYQRELVNDEDPELTNAIDASGNLLLELVSTGKKRASISTALSNKDFIKSWALVHGIATLWLSGSMGDPTNHKELEKILDRVFSE